MHSAHENPKDGNARMPWTYGDKGMEMAKKFFRLRQSLIPYIYTYARVVTEEALPIVRPMYLENPTVENAYKYTGQYYFGSELLVAPVTDSSGRKEVFFPAGDWYDYFTGEKVKGGQVLKKQYPLDRMPVYAKAGSIIPMQPDMEYSDQKPLDKLILDVYGPNDAKFELYEDDGVSLGYKSGDLATTQLGFAKSGDGYQLTVNPTKGNFSGQVKSRSYEMRFHGLTKPRTVTANGRSVNAGASGEERWEWDAARSVLKVYVKASDIKNAVNVVVK
jgi:alpha-glucosidase (family GH31 glycosyl hydrolase)